MRQIRFKIYSGTQHGLNCLLNSITTERALARQSLFFAASNLGKIQLICNFTIEYNYSFYTKKFLLNPINAQRQKVLIFRFSSLGDVLLTTPLIRALKRKNDGMLIDFVVKEQYSDLLKYNPRLNTVYTITRNYDFTEGKSPDFGSYDYIIDLQNNFRSKKILSGAAKPVYKFKKHSIAKFLAVKLKKTDRLPVLPVPERYIGSFPGIEADPLGCEFYFPPSFLPGENPGSQMIGICPGSKHFTKQWPVEYFLELSKKLLSSGYKVTVIGGADDKIYGEKIKNLLPEVETVCGADDLFLIGKTMKECRAVVCNDSGLMHLATACNVPVLAIFGSTIQGFGFAPYHAKSIILENNFLSCRPCSHIGLAKCPKKHFKCMKEILPEQVFQKLTGLTGR